MCTPAHTPADPSLFQCNGQAEGSFTRLECKKLLGCDSAASLAVAKECDFSGDPGDPVEDWEIAVKGIEVPFPPPQMDPEQCDTPSGVCNAQACCESDANLDQLGLGCVADCGFASCNKALFELQATLAAGPSGACQAVAGCPERFTDTLNTWIAFLAANMDVCVFIATSLNPDDVMNFPNPDVEAGAGTAVCGKLHIQCAADEQTPATDLEQTCSEGFNPELHEAEVEGWLCDLEGDVAVDGPQGRDVSPLEGAVAFRIGDCTSNPCWISIDQMVLEAEDYNKEGYGAQDMSAVLAYPAFGLLELGSQMDQGTIAPMMFGL